MEKEKQEEADLQWIQVYNEIHVHKSNETTSDRFARKFKENPIVPVGCLVTAGVLAFGLYSFQKGNRQMSQYMMRARVAAQGFTVVALLAGLGISAMKAK